MATDIKTEITEIVAKLPNEKNEEDIEKYIDTLWSIASQIENPDNKDMLRDLKALPLVLEFIEKMHDKPKILIPCFGFVKEVSHDNEENQKIFVDASVINYIDSALKDYFDEKELVINLIEATWTLGQSDKFRKGLLEVKNIIPSFVKVASKYLDEPEIVKVSAGAMLVAAYEDSVSVELINKDAVKACKSYLDKYDKDADICSLVFGLLGNLASEDKGRQDIKKLKICEKVIDIAQKIEDERLAIRSAGILRSCAISEDAKTDIIAMDAISFLDKISSKYADNANLLIRSYGCYVNLAIDYNSHEKLFKIEILKKVVDLAKKFNDNNQLLSILVRLIMNLCSNDEYVNNVVKSEAAAIPIELADNKLNEESLVSNAINCMRAMGYDSNENQKKLADLGAIRVIKKVLEKYGENDEIIRNSFGALTNISCCDDILPVFAESGVIPSAIEVMKPKIEKEDFVKGTIGTLVNISSDKECAKAIALSGGCELMIKIAKEHHDDSVISYKVAFIVMQLADIEDQKPKMVESGVVDVLSKIIDKNKDDEKCCLYSVSAIQILSSTGDQSILGALGEDEAVEKVLKVLKTFEHESKIVRQCVVALLNCAVNPLNASIINKEDGIKILVKILSLNKETPDIAALVLGAIQNTVNTDKAAGFENLSKDDDWIELVLDLMKKSTDRKLNYNGLGLITAATANEKLRKKLGDKKTVEVIMMEFERFIEDAPLISRAIGCLNNLCMEDDVTELVKEKYLETLNKVKTSIKDEQVSNKMNNFIDSFA